MTRVRAGMALILSLTAVGGSRAPQPGRPSSPTRAKARTGVLTSSLDEAGRAFWRLSYVAEQAAAPLLSVSFQSDAIQRSAGLLLAVESENPTQLEIVIHEAHGEAFFHLVVVPPSRWIERTLSWVDFCRVPGSTGGGDRIDPSRLSGLIEVRDRPGFMRERHRNALALSMEVTAGGAGGRHSPTSGAGGRFSSKVYERYVDKIEGGWLGKAAGGALGLPVEMLSYEEIARKYGRFSHYLSPPCGFGPDDDTSYQIAALAELLENGPSLKASELAEAYTRRMAPDYLWIGVRDSLRRVRMGILPPASGYTPLGECLGGQIRADVWGHLAPGDPERAARMAELDASITDFGEGICGARFIASAVSLAHVESDVRRVLARSLESLPESCRYRQVVLDSFRWHASYPNPEEAFRKLRAKYFEPIRERDPYQCWAYAIPNGGAVVLGLLYGEGDFGRSLALTARFGWDADCNAATVGSILGTLSGARALPRRWTEPLRDRLHCAVAGYEMCRISQVARWVAELAARSPELTEG